MSDGIRCMWVRGGTSKGGYFLADDLPSEVADRDAFLLRVMGSPDPRQIDGMGGGDPLTSKVAVVKRSRRKGIDVDYLFLQVFVDEARVSDVQNCGNILADVSPFAIERGLVKASLANTSVSIFMENTRQVAVATVLTPGGKVSYAGNARIEAIRLTACLIDGSPANEVAEIPYGARKTLSIEHPTGEMSCVLEINERAKSRASRCSAPRAS